MLHLPQGWSSAVGLSPRSATGTRVKQNYPQACLRLPPNRSGEYLATPQRSVETPRQTASNRMGRYPGGTRAPSVAAARVATGLEKPRDTVQVYGSTECCYNGALLTSMFAQHAGAAGSFEEADRFDDETSTLLEAGCGIAVRSGGQQATGSLPSAPSLHPPAQLQQRVSEDRTPAVAVVYWAHGSWSCIWTKQS